jgi:PhzF family phenazine biosynthesis protein
MQAFARWTNLSETTFLLAPTDARADYRVRIFTPGSEIPFAGHPTLGSCHAWLAASGGAGSDSAGSIGGRERVTQECGIGLVELRLASDEIAFAAPPLLRFEPVGDQDRAHVAAALGLRDADIVDASWVDNGPGWLGLLLRDADAVLALKPDFAAMMPFRVGVIGPYPAGGRTQFEVRGFAPDLGVNEDPVTGSLNAALAQWFASTGRGSDAYAVGQGSVVGRDGVVAIRREEDAIWVGGRCRTGISGEVLF